jgi:hypothetical protein
MDHRNIFAVFGMRLVYGVCPKALGSAQPIPKCD